MNAFGLLLWAIACTFLALVFGTVVLINGFSPKGFARSGHFYVVASLATLPFPLLLLGRQGPPVLGGLWVLAAGMRQMACIPLFFLGLALAALAVWQKRPVAMLVVTALLNLGSFAYLFLRDL